MALEHLNPDGLVSSPAFSQGVLSPRLGLVFVGGQNGTDASGTMREGYGAQTEQAFRNLIRVLGEGGCSPRDVLKLTIYVVGDEEVAPGLAAARTVWGDEPTAVSVLRVHGLARPDALVEIDAVAEVPENPAR